MVKKSGILKWIWWSLILILVIPFLQGQWHIAHIRPLKGYIVQAERDTFSWAKWFSGSFQPKEEKYLNETFGFREECVRINNQIAFSFFDKANANSVIIGKENYLYEENYIKAYYGTDFIGSDSINNIVKKLKYLQDTLQKQNITLIPILAPGKGSFYPEFIPDKFKSQKGITNFDIYTKASSERHLKIIDFNTYFRSVKHHAKYPVYPQYGIHWSVYSQCLAADSLIRYIEQSRHIDMPNIYWDKVQYKRARKEDLDIAEGMNLLFHPATFKMAYPVIHFQSANGKTKPSVLVIADSFYWGIFNFGISDVFSESHFWFYNEQVFPDSYKQPLSVSQLNLKEQIEHHDVIIILATDATLNHFGWGFIENTYDLFFMK